MSNILLLEGVHQCVVDHLKKYLSQNYNIIHFKSSLTEDQLIRRINEDSISIVGIRSKTHITKKVMDSCPSLSLICCFCIGTNQVDLEEAQKRCIPVFNSPYMNTRSVAELVISHIIALSRQSYQKNMEMHQKYWNKSSIGCHEVRGKTLGIIGYGHVGSQLSILAELLGLKVLFYDTSPVLPLGNSESMNDMNSLLRESDFVSIHVPLLDSTNDLIQMRELLEMKEGSFLINTSRGNVVNLDDLEKVLKDNHLSGAAIDVFPVEPVGNKCQWEHPLQKYPNVILTPHIGGATEEAQYQIGLDIGQKIVDYLQYGSTAGVVNLPEIISNQKFKQNGVIIGNFHTNLPGYISKINNLFAIHDININSLNLNTHDKYGYVLLSVDRVREKALKDIVKDIQKMDNSIRTFYIDY